MTAPATNPGAGVHLVTPPPGITQPKEHRYDEYR